MSNKTKLIENNLEELSKRIGLMIKQYNLLAESEDVEGRLILVTDEAAPSIRPAKDSHNPINIYDLVTEYNYEQGWSSSESCW